MYTNLEIGPISYKNCQKVCHCKESSTIDFSSSIAIWNRYLISFFFNFGDFLVSHKPDVVCSYYLMYLFHQSLGSGFFLNFCNLCKLVPQTRAIPTSVDLFGLLGHVSFVIYRHLFFFFWLVSSITLFFF